MLYRNCLNISRSAITSLPSHATSTKFNNNFEWFKRRALLITKIQLVSSQNVTGKTITETSSGNGVKQNKEQQLKLIRIFELL